MQDFAEDFASPNIPSDDATGTTALGLIGYQHGGDLEHALYQAFGMCRFAIGIWRRYQPSGRER